MMIFLDLKKPVSKEKELDGFNYTVASNDIAEFISLTEKELSNISDWLRVHKLCKPPPQNRRYGYWSSTKNK